MTAIIQTFVAMAKDETGVSSTEYALLLGIIGSTLAFGAVLLGTTISGAMGGAANTIAACSESSSC